MATLTQELASVRKRYEDEVKRKTERYNTERSACEADVRRADEFDYTKEFTVVYDTSLGSLERLFAEISDIHSHTKGLSFNINKYIGTVKPRTIAKGGVDEHLFKLVDECKHAIAAVKRNTGAPENDIPHLKAFCQGLVDLRYISKNGTKLVLDTGKPQKNKAAKMAEVEAALKRCIEKHTEILRTENLDCYGAMMDFKRKVLDEYARLQSGLIGNTNFGTNSDYRFLVGLHTPDIPSQDLKFAKDMLGLGEAYFSVEPILFEYTDTHSTILIKAKKDYFRTFEFDDLMNNIYYSLVSDMPAKELLFTGIEAGTKDAVLGGLSLKIMRNLKDGLFRDVATDLGGNDKINEVIKAINYEMMDRSQVYRLNSLHNVFEYNRTVFDNKQKLVLFAVNHYPCGFNKGNGDGYRAIEEIATQGGSKGIITVICEATDEEYGDRLPALDAATLHADLITVTDGGELFYNGRRMNPNIRTKDFDPRQYLSDLSDYFEGASSLMLPDVISKCNAMLVRDPLPPFYERIRIPIGNAGGEMFELNMKSCSEECFGLIIGTTGSGKSSFLHTLILSAASRYSPDELRFCLVDFKSERDSPEFTQYRKSRDERNLYIPHVDYLLVNGKTEYAIDVFQKIKSIATERSTIMSKYTNCTEVSKYNASPEVQSGRAPKLPIVFFVIDEYNAMISGGGNGSHAVGGRIVEELFDTLRRVRAYGIGILLCGQSVDDKISLKALPQMGTRISLSSTNDYNQLMSISSREAQSDMSHLSGIGYSVFSTNKGRTRIHVRHAYSGYTGCDMQLKLAERIREKYPDEVMQFEAGSSDSFAIDDARELSAFKSDSELSAASDVLDTSFDIPIGVAPASMLKISLRYKTSGGMNYMAFAGRNQLFRIERNAILGYIEKCRGMNAPVTYMASPADTRAAFGFYLQNYPALAKRMKTVTKRAEMAEEIYRLHELFKARKIEATDNLVDYDPMFIVMHDISWMKDEDDTTWLPKNNAQRESSEPKPRPKLDMPEVSGVGAGASGMIAARILAMKKKSDQPAAAREEVKPIPTTLAARDFCEMLSKLYAYGSQYGIYMLIGSESYHFIENILLAGRSQDEKKSATESFSVWGSAKEMEGHTRDEFAPQNCVYICPNRSTIRLFDYSPECGRDWWRRTFD